MRIVSQDGTFDFPYEHIVVYRNELNIVCGLMPDIREKILLGKYSTREKAIKAMKMVREAYMGLPVVFQNANIDDSVLESFKNHNVVLFKSYDEPQSKVEYVNSGIFQFPKDDEIEV